MNEDTELKEPLESMIRTGYNIRKMVVKAKEYAWMAHECLGEAVEDMKEDDVLINQFDVTKQKAEILRIMADIEEQGELLHKKLANKSEGYGYRPITNADFETIGALPR